MLNKILFKLYKYGVLKYFNFLRQVSINGKDFKIPILGNVGLTNLFLSEPWMIDLLKALLSIENKLFVDVGVNIGQTLLKLRSVSNDINYIGFEPNPLCVNYTAHLIEANGFINTSILPVAISEHTALGELNFFSKSSTDSAASIIDNFRPGQKIIKKEYIPVFDIDSISKSIDMKDVSILKIDVEGAELEVIKSFRSLIHDKNPFILMEILPAYHEDNNERIDKQNEIQAILNSLQYSIFRIKKQDEILEGVDEIEEIGVHSDLNACEYVMVPKQKKSRFLAAVNSL